MIDSLIKDFHFLHSYWFLAFLPLTLLIFSKRKKISNSNLKKICDEHLLKYLLDIKVMKNKVNWQYISWLFIVILLIFILAAPVYQKKPTPLFSYKSNSLVIVLDLSRSMNARDIKPTRLIRAKLKIKDILQISEAGKSGTMEVALVVYSDQAFTVTPLSDDVVTINSFLDALESNIMPNQGSNELAGISKAVELLQGANLKEGHILLISDGVKPSNLSKIKKILNNHLLSVLGVGTPVGSPVIDNGNYLKDRTGNIVISKLDEDSLKLLSSLSKGIYQRITNDKSDIQKVLSINSAYADKSIKQTDKSRDIWQEEWQWLLILVLALLLNFFRKGLWIILLIPVFPLDYAKAANDDTHKQNQLIKFIYSKNFRAQKAYDAKDFARATNLFENERWVAESLYQQGKYQAALEKFSKFNEADDLYNQANTLAKLGKLEQAIIKYEQAIKKSNNNHPDAIENKRRVAEFLARQKQQQNKKNQQANKSAQNQAKQKKDNTRQTKGGQGEQKDKQTKGKQFQYKDKQAKELQNQQGKNNLNKEKEQKPNNDNSTEQKTRKELKKSANSKINKKLTTKNKEKKSVNQIKDNHKKSQQNKNKAQQVQQDQEDKQKKEQELKIKFLFKKVEDDPGSLLRRKFFYQYKQDEENKYSEDSW